MKLLSLLLLLVFTNPALADDDDKQWIKDLETLTKTLENKDHFWYPGIGYKHKPTEGEIKVTIYRGISPEDAAKKIDGHVHKMMKAADVFSLGHVIDSDVYQNNVLIKSGDQYKAEIYAYLKEGLRPEHKQVVEDLLIKLDDSKFIPGPRLYGEALQLAAYGTSAEVLGHEMLVISIDENGWRPPNNARVIVIEWSYCHC